MTKAQRINRGMFALGFLGAYSLAALLLLLTLNAGSADRYTGAGVTHRNGDIAAGSDDFTSDIATLTDFEKYPGRLGPDKSNPGAPDDATSAIGDGPAGSGFFADNGFSGSPGDLQQASFVTGTNAPGRGRANFVPALTGSGVPEFGGGGAPFGAPTFIPSGPGGTGTGPGPSPTPDTPPPNPPPGPPDGPPPGPFVPDTPPPDPPPGPPPPPVGPNPPGPPLSIPEPLTLSIFAMGLAGVAALRRGRKKPA